MARTPPTAPAAPADFLRALDAFNGGSGSLPQLRDLLRAVLLTEPRHAQLLRTLIERARDEGRLAAPAAAALLRPTTPALSEELPTAWPDEGGSEPPSAAAAVATGLRPGHVLKDRFVLEEALAGGAMAEVYRALDRRRAEAGQAPPWVVLKVAPAASAAARALQREAALASRLAHPNISRVLDLDRDGPYLFLTIEWLDGESLAHLLDQRQERPLTRRQALPIVEGIGRALAHAHAEGLVHGDVKPGNIMVSVDGRAKLLDFGVARDLLADGETPRGLTPEYASPALLAGEPPTAADDLFALACVAYRMLAGVRPFGEQPPGAALAAGQRPAPIDALAPGQWRALERALAPAAGDRQADMGRFLAEFKGPRDDPAAASGERRAGAARRPSKPVALAAAAGIATVAIAGFWLLRAPGADDTPTAGTQAATSPGELAVAADPPAGTPTTAPRTQLPAPVAGPPRPTVPTPPRQAAGGARPPAPDRAPAGTITAAVQRAAPPLPTAPAAPPTASATLVALDAGAVINQERSGGAPLVPAPAALPAADAKPAATPTPAAGGVASADPAGERPLSALGLKRYVEADYPRAAAARRTAGWVEIGFRVDAAGRPQDLRVVSAEPAGLFDAAAVAAVRRWRFARPPAGEEPRSRVRVRFSPEP